jgi:Secretion system C-terminal sorting domain
MNKQLVLLMVIIFSELEGFAQQLPVGACGIVYIHDAAGNRTKRLYFCNNGSPYPSKPGRVTISANQNLLTEEELKNAEFSEVVAIYPDPTNGIFQIGFSKALKNATISIIDLNGKVLQRFKATGSHITCNISNAASGEYFVRIDEDGKKITKKVIKQ